MRRFIVAAAAATALLSACGGDDGGSSAGSDSAAESTTSVVSATPTSAASASATTAAPATGSATTASGATAAGAVDVVLKEWSITSGQLNAGTVTLNVKNDGDFKHELVVIKGKFASLPKTSSGSVDTSALPAGALVGEAEDIAGGASTTLAVDLAAGDYTLVCNITGGGSSHASRGQVLDISVV
ncbi:MAG: hypothetical protein AB7V43_02060 [Acidimicrobiia bacterium]